MRQINSLKPKKQQVQKDATNKAKTKPNKLQLDRANERNPQKQ